MLRMCHSMYLKTTIIIMYLCNKRVMSLHVLCSISLCLSLSLFLCLSVCPSPSMLSLYLHSGHYAYSKN